jgi:hypothetical protein
MDGAFRAKISPPHYELGLNKAHLRLCRWAFRPYWAILRFLVKGIEWRDYAAISDAGLFAIRSGARGKEGARVEN